MLTHALEWPRCGGSRAVFAMAVSFKLYDIGGTATYIASAGFPMATLLAWLAVALELGLVVCLATGAYFSEAVLVATAYVLFLGSAFHGPSHWSENQSEFGFFVHTRGRLKLYPGGVGCL